MDLRDIHGVKIPFRVRASRSDPRYDELIVVESMSFNEPLAGVSFAKPPPPRPDFAFPAGRSFVEVPFEQYNGHLFVKVMLNGKGPYRMLFDSAASNVLMPRMVAKLGLKPEDAAGGAGIADSVGVTRLDRLDMGGVVLERQAFATIDLDALMRRVEGLDDVAGVVGFELFKRFPIKLDYERSRAIIHNPVTFKYTGAGSKLPVVFRGTQPQVRASVDGIDGIFRVDTGSRGSLTLTLPFAEDNDLARKYDAKFEVISGAGVGGAVMALLARAKTLELAGFVIKDPVTTLALQQSGTLADPDLAGNLGYGILRQFNITFDFAAGALYLEKNANFGQREVYDRAGLWIERSTKGFEVVYVVTGGPADEAGLRTGDVIVAINGKPALPLGLSAARSEFRAAPGRKVRVRLDNGPDRVVTLRDLV